MEKTVEPKDLSAIATGREYCLFQSDIEAKRADIEHVLNGSRVLVIGGAGSIGSATFREIVPFCPAALHVIDQNENELAELIRILRSSGTAVDIPDLRTLPLDYGSAQFQSFVRHEGPYDLVLNFAAIKHVRSEKDSYSTLQMFDTNIMKQARLLQVLKSVGFRGRYFSVSTDKAANPTSLMGASKRVMEHVMFDGGLGAGLDGTITSARFANVAFSNGSLLQSFENRLRKDQPLAAPKDTRRYFVSLKESGQLCLLAATIAPHRHIAVPNLNPETSLFELQRIAEDFLTANGYAPRHYFDEGLACAAVAEDKASGRWPLLLTELSTSGEKPYEEFVAEGEARVAIGCEALSAVPYLPLAEADIMRRLLAEMQRVFDDAANKPVSKEALKALIAIAEPAFLNSHRETGLNLDQRV